MKLRLIPPLLLLLAGVAVAQERVEMGMQMYDISALVTPRVSRLGPRLGPQTKYGFHQEWEEPEPQQWMEGDALADLIRDTIDQEVWDEGGDVQYRQGGILLVKAPISTQAKIDKLIRDLDAAASRRVKLQVRVIDLNKGEYEEMAEGLPEDLDLAARSPRESGSVEAYPGVTSTLKVTNRVRYVADYDVEIAQGSQIPDPVVEAAEDGLVVEVTPFCSLDGTRIALEGVIQRGEISPNFREVKLAVDEEYFAEPFRSPSRSHTGTVQLPTYTHMDASFVGMVEPGGTLVVPVVDGNRSRVFLIQADLLGGAPPGLATDIGLLTLRPVGAVFGYHREVEDEYRTITAPGIFRREEDRIAGGAEEIMDLIVSNVGWDYWEEEGASINVFSDSRLVIRADDQIFRSCLAFLRDLEKKLIRPVTLDVRAYSVSAPVTAGPRRTFAPEGDAYLRWAGSVPTLLGARAGFMAGNTKNIICDYDVEVAQEARIADPIVGQSFEGIVANLTPRLSADRTRVLLTMEMLLAARRPGDRLFDTGAQTLGPVDMVSEKRTVIGTTVEFPVGHVYVLDGGPDPLAPNRRLAVVLGAKIR